MINLIENLIRLRLFSQKIKRIDYRKEYRKQIMSQSFLFESCGENYRVWPQTNYSKNNMVFTSNERKEMLNNCNHT